MSIIMTKPIAGLSGGSWKRIQRPAQRSWWRFVRRFRKSLFQPTKKYRSRFQPKPRLFDHVADEELLSYGVPPEWLADVREANEDSLLTLADHLPSEAAEALLELATGGKPAECAAAGSAADRRSVSSIRMRSVASE